MSLRGLVWVGKLNSPWKCFELRNEKCRHFWNNSMIFNFDWDSFAKIYKSWWSSKDTKRKFINFVVVCLSWKLLFGFFHDYIATITYLFIKHLIGSKNLQVFQLLHVDICFLFLFIKFSLLFKFEMSMFKIKIKCEDFKFEMSMFCAILKINRLLQVAFLKWVKDFS